MAGIWDHIAGLFAQRQVGDARYPAQRMIPFSPAVMAGVRVTPDTAITVPAVWACLRYLSQTVAFLPWHVMLQSDNGGRQAPTHPVDWLLYKRPNPEWSSFQFRETLTHWALRHGNGYAEIERDPIGRPMALWPIHPRRVLPFRDDVNGVLRYRVFAPNTDSLAPTELDAADMFHLRGFGEDVVGLSVIEYAAESIGWAKAAQIFGASFFGSGMNIAGVVQSKKPMNDTAMRRLRAGFNRMYRGVKGERMMFLDDGMEYKSVGIEPEKGQFLATNNFLVSEICRWFGVPPHKVAQLERSTLSNIEHQGIEVVVDSISPWCKRFEDEADYKLFGQNRQGYYTKLNLNALMRGDSVSRSGFYEKLRQLGALSVNDILRFEDMNTISAADGGDKRVMQAQFTTLDKIGEAPPAPTVIPAGESTPSHNPSPGSEPSRSTPASPTGARERAAMQALATLELELEAIGA
jgi:HK97 family phage portal protein